MSSRSLALAVMLAVLLPAALAPSVAARTGPNPEGRALPVVVSLPGPAAAPSARAQAPAGAEAALAVIPVPLPAGAVQLDSTYYDLQDLGTLGTRIVIGSDGRVHATWEDDLCSYAGGGCPPRAGRAALHAGQARDAGAADPACTCR